MKIAGLNADSNESHMESHISSKIFSLHTAVGKVETTQKFVLGNSNDTSLTPFSSTSFCNRWIKAC